MSRSSSQWIAVSAVVACAAGGMPALGEQLAVGQQLVTAAEVLPAALAGGQPVLRLTVSRAPEAPLPPLSLQVRLADPSGKPSENSRLLTTFSFFGVKPGQVTVFEEPLPDDAFRQAKDGKLSIELRLSSSARPEVAAAAKIDVKRAVVEPKDAVPAAGVR